MTNIDFLAAILGSNILLIVVQYITGRKKQTAEIRDIATQTYSRLLEDLNDQIELLKQDKTVQEERITSLRKRLDVLAAKELEYLQQITAYNAERERLLLKISELEQKNNELLIKIEKLENEKVNK